MATWAFVARIEGFTEFEDFGVLPGAKSNNQAEYVAIGKALRWAVTWHKMAHKIHVFSDSQFAINQINGIWQINADHLQAYSDRIKKLVAELPAVEFSWIPSAQNTAADELTRRAYKQETGKEPPIRHKKGAR